MKTGKKGKRERYSGCESGQGGGGTVKEFIFVLKALIIMLIKIVLNHTISLKNET